MKPGAQNGIVGDESVTELPQTAVPKDELIEERKMAQFSKTDEFQRLKKHLEERVVYYQRFLPGSTDTEVQPMNHAQLGEAWKVATAIIGEFEAVLAAYELAGNVVAEHDRQAAR